VQKVEPAPGSAWTSPAIPRVGAVDGVGPTRNEVAAGNVRGDASAERPDPAAAGEPGLLWRVSTSSTIMSRYPSPIAVNRSGYSSADDAVTAVNATTGQTRWRGACRVAAKARGDP
jgi:hypothetical protein